MEVVRFKTEHFWAIEVQDAQAYVKLYVKPDYLKALEYQYSFSVIHDGEVLACLGCFEVDATRGCVWAYISKHAGAHFSAIHSLAKQIIADVPYKRLESEVDFEFEQGHRWMKMLGFSVESECMKHAAADGGDCTLYSMVK